MGIDSNYIYGGHTAFARYAEGSQTNVGLAVDGSLKTSRTLPAYYELAKAGRIYVASGNAHAGKAPVTAVPTTAAAWALYNGNTSASSLVLYILSISIWQVSGTNGLGGGLMVGLSPTVQASAITSASGVYIKSTSASARTTAATLGVDATLAGNPAWESVGSVLNTANVNVGGGLAVQMNGEYAVPAGFALGITWLSPAGTSPLYTVAVKYAEIESYLV